jgi:multiple sugar transport system substrate-binding protein
MLRKPNLFLPRLFPKKTQRKSKENPMKKCNMLTLILLTLVVAPTALAQAKTTLTVNCFTHMDEAVSANIPAYQELHPEVEIKMNILGFDDHHAALKKTMQTGLGAGDVNCIDIGFVNNFMEGGGLVNLDDAPYNAKQYKNQMTPYAWMQAQASDGHNYSMPANVASGTMFYRKDILDRLGVKTTDLTKSWDSFIATGKKMKAKDPTIFLIGNAASVAPLYWKVYITDGEYEFFDKNGKKIVNSPRFVKAFELAKQIHDAQLDAKVTEESAEWVDGLNKGTIAVQFSGAWFENTLREVAPQTAGLWRAADLPNQAYAFWGGSYYAIPKESRKKTDAWEFIKYLTTTKEAQLTALKANGALPVLRAAQNLPEIKDPLPFLGGQQARVLWIRSANKIRPIEVNKLDPAVSEQVGVVLRRVLEEGVDIKTALTEANNEYPGVCGRCKR